MNSKQMNLKKKKITHLISKIQWQIYKWISILNTKIFKLGKIISESKNPKFGFAKKGDYIFENPFKKESTERKFEEIIWFFRQLRRDFPGLKLPKQPENNLESIQKFFNEIIQIEIIFEHHLTKFFFNFNDDSTIKEYMKKRDFLFVKEDSLTKLKSFFTDPVIPNKKELDLLLKKGNTLEPIKKTDNADSSFFAENLVESGNSILFHFNHVQDLCKEIEVLYSTLKYKFQLASNKIEMVASIVKKLNFAKNLFPVFEENQINLDVVLMKLKLGFEAKGKIRRKKQRKRCPDYVRNPIDANY